MAKQTQELKVTGMTCPHCVHAVKTAVSGVKGVDMVDVSLEKKRVTVSFDADAASLDAIRGAIKDAGYTAH